MARPHRDERLQGYAAQRMVSHDAPREQRDGREGKAVACWSHDGEAAGDGIESPVYGAEQVARLCSDYVEVMQYLFDQSGGAIPERAATKRSMKSIARTARDFS